MNAADLVLAGGRAEAPALVSEEGTLSRGALWAMAGRYGNGLAGLGRGARVILVLDDSPALFAAFLGAIRVGAVPVAVNPRMRGDELGVLIEDSGAALVLAEPEYADAARAAGGRVLVAANGLFDREPETLASAEMAGDDPAFWVYTSGSTGTPKGAVHRHRAARSTRSARSSSAPRSSSTAPGRRPTRSSRSRIAPARPCSTACRACIARCSARATSTAPSPRCAATSPPASACRLRSLSAGARPSAPRSPRE
jgi:acyl-CoA synthetase (AMP-forming)/AMP-acid ligase II